MLTLSTAAGGADGERCTGLASRDGGANQRLLHAVQFVQLALSAAMRGARSATGSGSLAIRAPRLAGRDGAMPWKAP